MHGFCFKEKAKREFARHGKVEKTPNNRYMYVGNCATCGSGMSTIISKKEAMNYGDGIEGNIPTLGGPYIVKMKPLAIPKLVPKEMIK